MGQQLFSTGRVGVFFDTYAPAVEKRRGEEVSVIKLRCRVQPFDSKLATALDDGVGDDSNIKAGVFSMNTGDPKPNFTRHDFTLGLDRQNLIIYTTPDTTDAKLAILQAKISDTYVRTQKDMNALEFVFTATFGPVGKDELAVIHALHRSQAFIKFETAEPLLEHEDDGEEDDDEDLTEADEKARIPAPMFTTDESGKPVDEGAEAKGEDVEEARPTARRHATRAAAAKARQGAERGSEGAEASA